MVVRVSPPGPGGRRGGLDMPGTTKTMGVFTIGGLVVVTAYTVALGSNGWLWFGWVVLGLLTLAMTMTRD
ncbi:integral membrane protein [Streptomyces sp. SPB074]|nr:integral membrane protein [Streptomyces sp. SPB074]